MSKRIPTRLRLFCTVAVVLVVALLMEGAAVHALDLFGAKETENAEPQPPMQAGRLPNFVLIAKNTMPAVVNISTTQKSLRRPRRRQRPMPGPFGGEDPFEEFFRRFFGDRPPQRQRRSLGSGFIISEDGYIVTNEHVVDGADKITVRLSDEDELEAEVIGTDDKTDIALIKIEPSQPLQSVPLGSSSSLQVGDWVMAIGNPFGLEQTVTAGIVSAKGRVIGAGPYDDFIQTDASINPGNSGGPLLNLKGEVVGINSAIFSQGGGNIGIGFAIPIDMARAIIQQLQDTGKVTRGWLGVAIQTVTSELAESFDLDEPIGALVAEVTSDGPAQKAGVERGDIITHFKGEKVLRSHDLPAMVARTPVGEEVQITVLRGGKQHTITVTLGELTDRIAQADGRRQSQAGWGMTVAGISDEHVQRYRLPDNQQGIVVTEVEPGGPAELAGIRPGDVIEEVNRQTVRSVNDFTSALKKAEQSETLLLLVRRGNSTSFLLLRKQS